MSSVAVVISVLFQLNWNSNISRIWQEYSSYKITYPGIFKKRYYRNLLSLETVAVFGTDQVIKEFSTLSSNILQGTAEA